MKVIQKVTLVIILQFPLIAIGKIDSTAFFKGWVAFEKENFTEAIDFIQQGFNTGEVRPRFLLKKGIAEFHTEQYTSAIAELQKIRDTYKSRASVFLARCYAQTGNFDNAIKQLKTHVNQRFRLSKSALQLDTNFNILAETKKWRRFWEIEYYDKYDQWLNEAGFEYKDGNNKAALKLLDKILDNNKNNYKARFLRARVFFRLEDYRAALRDIKQVDFLKHKHPEFLFWKAKIYKEKKSKRKALKAITKAVDIAPFNLRYRKELAEIYAFAGEIQNSMNTYRLYLTYYPRDAEVNYETGRVLFEQERYLDALEYFNTCLNLDNTTAKYFVARGDAYLKTNTYKYAIRDYSMALDIDPKKGEVYYNKGIARFRSGDAEGACMDWEKAIQYGYNKAVIKREKFCKEEIGTDTKKSP